MEPTSPKESRQSTATPQGVLPEHVQENRRYWDGMADEWVAPGERHWRQEAPTWGIWSIPESELQMLPEDMSDQDAIELGCGTGYVSNWMARRGAKCVGIDNSEKQLDTARRLAEEHDTELTLLHGNAETVPYPDASFDFAISEYGAAIWCDPYAWIPEAHRLLRPGGQLVFLASSAWATACSPLDGSEVGFQLVRSYFTTHRTDWREVEIDPGGVEFQLPASRWFRLFRDTGFEVLDFIEIQAPEDQVESKFHVPADWAKKYPSEVVWKLRKR